MKFFLTCLLFLCVYSTEYGVIIDAGSSGSRAFVYSWPDRTYKSLPPSISIPVTQEKWATKVTPAITTFVNDLSQLSSYISSLVQFAMGVLKVYSYNCFFPIIIELQSRLFKYTNISLCYSRC